jgi:hypothetical protein
VSDVYEVTVGDTIHIGPAEIVIRSNNPPRGRPGDEPA